MEIRSTINAVRHFVLCLKQQRCLSASSPVLYVCSKVGNPSSETALPARSFSSTSSHQRQRLGLWPSISEGISIPRTSVLSFEIKDVVFCVGSVRHMAGHSKWANIRHIKAAKDSQKAKVITEFSRKLRAFIRETGQIDPKTSTQLAKMMSDAKSKNVPKDTIDKILVQMSALKNSTPTWYEAKGPSGSVMLIEALTTKKTHTKGELQGIIKKCGFSMVESSSLARMTFEEKGIVQVNCPEETAPDMDSYVDIAIEAGAEEVTLEEDEEGSQILQFVCEPDDVYTVKKELELREMPVSSAEVIYNAINTVPLDSDTLELVAKALDKLDDHPDVLKVYLNVEEAS